MRISILVTDCNICHGVRMLLIEEERIKYDYCPEHLGDAYRTLALWSRIYNIRTESRAKIEQHLEKSFEDPFEVNITSEFLLIPQARGLIPATA